MKGAVMIRQITVGDYNVRTYVVTCPITRRAVLIDPAGQEAKIVNAIEADQARIEYILNTHGHADHVVSNQKLKTILSAMVCMHEADDRFFSDDEIRKKAEKELGLPGPAPADMRLKDGDVLHVGTMKVKVIHTPGHTPGSVCFLVDGNLFTGDTLFVGDVGRTDLTGGSLDTLIDSLAQKVITLPDKTIVWPGHDYGESPTSTIGREKAENPYITDFILDP